MTQTTFKIFYNRTDEGKVDVWISSEPSQTLLAFTYEADINVLVARSKQPGSFYYEL